jgi:hypothetical protein
MVTMNTYIHPEFKTTLDTGHKALCPVSGNEGNLGGIGVLVLEDTVAE